MAVRIRLTQEQADQLVAEMVDKILSGESAGEIMALLESAEPAQEE